MKDSLHFQFKAQKEIFTANQLVTEAKKVAFALTGDKKITLVIAALNIDTKIAAEPAPLKIYGFKKDVVSMYFLPKSIILDWEIPANMDIVVLLKAGMEQLIIPHNLELFISETQNFQDCFDSLHNAAKKWDTI